MDDAIRKYHLRRKARMDAKDKVEVDGGPGSGNWGHVGVPGQWGGSAPGGGVSFRMEKSYNVKNLSKKYNSKAKIQQKIKSDLKKAQAAGNQKRITQIQNRIAKQGIDMNRKSAAWLKKTGEYDPQASKNISGDKNRSESKTKYHNTGTKEAINNTFRSGKQKSSTQNPANAQQKPPQTKQSTTKQNTQKQTNKTATSKPTQNGQNSSKNTQSTNNQQQQQQQKSQQQQQNTQAQKQSGTHTSPNPTATKSFASQSDHNKATAIDSALAKANDKSNDAAARAFGAQNNAFQNLAMSTGIAQKPNVVDSSEFKNVSGTKLYRTINADTQAKLDGKINNTLHSDDTVFSHNGSSCVGRGIYFDTSISGSLAYQDRNRETATFTAKISPNAKIADYRTTYNNMRKESKSGSELGNALSNVMNNGRSDSYEDAVSIYAVSQGIQCLTRGSYHSVLDPSILTYNNEVRTSPAGIGIDRATKKKKY